MRTKLGKSAIVQITTKDNLIDLQNFGESAAWRLNVKRIFKGQKLRILSMQAHNGQEKGSFITATITGLKPVIVNGKRRYSVLFTDSDIHPSSNPFIKFLRQPIRYFN